MWAVTGPIAAIKVFWAPLVFLGVFLLVVFVPLLIVVAIVRLVAGRPKGSPNGKEMEAVQEIHRNLSQMETRIEALETILLDKKEG